MEIVGMWPNVAWVEDTLLQFGLGGILGAAGGNGGEIGDNAVEISVGVQLSGAIQSTCLGAESTVVFAHTLLAKLFVTVGDTPLMFTTAGLRSWVVAETELFLDKFGVNGQRAVGPLGVLEDSNLGGDQNVRIKVHGGIMEVGALRDGK
jgi:hypothetical protein